MRERRAAAAEGQDKLVGRVTRYIFHQRRGDDQRAIGFFTRALKEKPEREDIHRQVMSLYMNQGMLEDAVMQYRKLEQVLHDTLKITPSRETRELYDTLEARRR